MSSFISPSNFDIDFSVIKTIPYESFSFLVILLALFCLYFLYKSYRALTKARTIEDMPTAKIRSVAQGYTELKGEANCVNNRPIIAPLTQHPCVWYRFVIERMKNKRWCIIEKGESEDFFELDDSTGVCLVDPFNAQIEFATYEHWSGFNARPQGKPKSLLSYFFSLFGHFRYHEWRIEEKVPLYALGNFHTIRISTNPDSSSSQYQATIKASHVRWYSHFMHLLSITNQSKNQPTSPTEWKERMAHAYLKEETASANLTASHQQAINFLSGHGLIPRMPFIISVRDEKKTLNYAKRDAFIWFIGYVALTTLLIALLIIRLK